tara:strand:+ start:243982 stop:244878 length:897 start_codon:yes stop_codon:yes gene_type:complete
MDKLYVKIADTPSKQAHGLMFVKKMENDHGMLFEFDRPQRLSFWGQNTFIPLDIAFCDSDGVIRKISHIPPLSEKIVASESPCKYAVEANFGYFEGMKIEPGDRMVINNNGDGSFLTFDSKRRNYERSASSSKARQILAQLMGDQAAYGLPEEEEIVEDQNLPTINAEDIGAYLEDDLEEPPPQEIEPPEPEMPASEEVQDVEQPPQPEEIPQFSNAFDASEWAEDNNQVMRINYTTKHGTGLIRDVEPHGQFHADTTGRQILVTFDRTIGDIRAFILKNITQFAFTGETFEPRFKLV